MDHKDRSRDFIVNFEHISHLVNFKHVIAGWVSILMRIIVWRSHHLKFSSRRGQELNFIRIQVQVPFNQVA